MFNENSAVFFDFDGVLIDSTELKTDAYKEIFMPYGPDVVTKIVRHHLKHGGISRVEKIKYAHTHFIDEPYSDKKVAEHAQQYSDLVFEKVIHTDWVPGAREFVEKHYKDLPLFIISGTPEVELLQIVKRRNMSHYFQEILGSPIKKPQHIRSLASQYKLEIKNCFFIGDALTDYHAAKETGMPFVGILTEIAFPEGTIVLPDCNDLMEAMALARADRSALP